MSREVYKIDNNGAVDGADLVGIAADFGNTGCQIP